MGKTLEKSKNETLEGVQKYDVITRNYSRKEGSEMFSLTVTRHIEVESTFYRKRAEMYLALYDVEIQVLEEMVAIEFVTKPFLANRKKVLLRQLEALRIKMSEEIESGNLTDFQIHLNELTFAEIDLRK